MDQDAWATRARLNGLAWLVCALAAFPALGATGCTPPCARTGTCVERPDDLQPLPPGLTALYQPRGDAEALLGLPVEVGPDGELVIGEARRPGCEVTVKRVPTVLSLHYEEDLGKVASFAAGRESIASLKVQYGKSLRVESRVDNQEELVADLRGTCGARVVKRVQVGRGWREVKYAKSASGGASVNVKGVPIGGSGGSWERVGGRLEWPEPHAWAFAVGNGTRFANDIEIEMPASIRSGDTFTATVEVERPLWVVVLYRDALGSYGVVIPSAELRELQVLPGTRVPLPAMRSQTLEGHTRDTEKLIVYGFAEEGDFKAFRPPAGVLTPEEQDQYGSELQRRLEDPNALPRDRWVRSEFGFEILAGP